MRILIIEPEKAPYRKEIDGSLTAMQAVVGGPIQAVYPFEQPIALVCHEEGKLQGLPLNRALYEPGNPLPYDIISGTFFLCAAPPDCDSFASLPEADMRQFEDLFRYPETFLRIGGTILSFPVEVPDAE